MRKILHCLLLLWVLLQGGKVRFTCDASRVALFLSVPPTDPVSETCSNLVSVTSCQSGVDPRGRRGEAIVPRPRICDDFTSGIKRPRTGSH